MMISTYTPTQKTVSKKIRICLYGILKRQITNNGTLYFFRWVLHAFVIVQLVIDKSSPHIQGKHSLMALLMRGALPPTLLQDTV